MCVYCEVCICTCVWICILKCACECVAVRALFAMLSSVEVWVSEDVCMS